MKTKDFIKKIDDNILDWSLENQKSLKDVPADLDDKIFSMIDEETENYKAENLIIKKNKIISFDNLKFRYTFAFSCAAVIFFVLLGLFIFKPEIIPFYKRNLLVEITNTNGEVYLEKKNKKITSKKLKRDTVIKSGGKSSTELKIGSGTVIKINENSIVKLLESYQYKNDEHLKLQFNQGSIDCEVLLKTTKSNFIVLTDVAEFEVTGTKFNIISIDDDLQLMVEKGTVEIKDIIKLNPDKKINKIKNKKILKVVKKIESSRVEINAGQQITLNKKIIKKINNEYNSMLTKRILTEKNINKKDIEKIEKEFLSFKQKTNEIISNEIIKYDINTNRNHINIEEIVEEKMIVKKINNFFNGKLGEKDTAITSDSKNIIISSGVNKSIYYINPNNGKLIWSFNDKSLKNITSMAVGYKNYIVIPSHEKIFILNKDGSIHTVKDIHEGTSFWADSRIINNKLFIPGYKNIFIFDGNNIAELENINNINGQIYLNQYSDNIVLNCLNDKKILVYNLSADKITWSSNNLNNRSFISPIILKNVIVTADLSGNIYKYNYNSDSNKAQMLKIDCNISSEFIYKNGFIYFIGGDGYLYKLNINSFKSPVKIVQADENPRSEKYLVKKLLLNNNKLYFSSDNGKLLVYSINDSNYSFIDVNKNGSLIGSPVKIGQFIYIIDDSGSIYKLSKFEN